MADDNDKKQDHTLSDHVLGEDFAHSHDGVDADHDHDRFDGDGPLEENPIWIADHVTLTSVGMDIGSSGTQVVFSKMNLRRFGEDLSNPLLRGIARDPVSVSGGADALPQRGIDR